MKPTTIIALKALRKLYTTLFPTEDFSQAFGEQNPNIVSKMIYEKLTDDKPCMIARFGATELTTMVNYLGVIEQQKNFWKYIQGQALPWWWNKNMLNQMRDYSGFFPPIESKVEQFCLLMQKELKEVDILGSWLPKESYFDDKMKCEKVDLRLLEPFWSDFHWTKALKGKRVLVIHPFDTLINYQYQNNRTKLFDDKDILPEFELVTLKAVQSLGGNCEFTDWFEALDWMKGEVDKIDFDICIVGAGAYGFPLAAYVKRKGKKAFHMGGALQLLFGIIGKRWEDPNYGVKLRGIAPGSYSNLINEYWKRPGDELRPKTAHLTEDACYW